MAKVAAEKQSPLPVWTVDPLLSAYTPNNIQESNSSGVDNSAFYDSESALCTKIPSVHVVEPCHRKHRSWLQPSQDNLYTKKQCNSRLLLILLSSIVLFLLVSTIATVAYLTVGELQTWDDGNLQVDNEGISVVEGHLRITNRIFSNDLLNPKSMSFHKLTSQVMQSMDAVFLQSGLSQYYNETGVLNYMEGSTIVRCRIHLLKPRLDATHQVGMAVIQALERYHGYLPGGLLQVDIRSLHFTGLLDDDDDMANEIKIPIASWGAWSNWSECENTTCGYHTRHRVCVGEHGSVYSSSQNGPCGMQGGINKEVRKCPCNPPPIDHTTKTPETDTLPTFTETQGPIIRRNVGEECSGDCEHGQVCIMLPQTPSMQCLVSRDINDPTGCGGWCVGQHQHCKQLTNSTFQCVDSAESCADEEKEWRCDNGLCVPKSGRCDGQLDCYDMTDEFGCECQEEEFHCSNNTSCIPKQFQCNGQVDCWDGSDEQHCSSPCPVDQYMCNSGHCIDKLHFCDGYPDCDDGSDEPEGCNAPCLHTQDRCQNGRCINILLWCNGVNNCGDNSDEISCKNLPMNTTTTSPH